jgi:hypothetical protein
MSLGFAVSSDDIHTVPERIREFDYEASVENIKRYNEMHGMANEIGRLIVLYEEVCEGEK